MVIIYCKNIARGNAPYFPYLGQINRLQLKCNYELQDFQRVFDLNARKKKGLSNLIFLALLSNVTNLVVSNVSEHLQNVIHFH